MFVVFTERKESIRLISARQRTNPVSDKILIISEVLGVSPHELLFGAEHSGERSRENQNYVISKGT